MNKNHAAALFNKFAHQYAAKYMDVQLYAASLDVFCEAIKFRNATVLELACGPGNITKYLLAKLPDLKILATDLAPKMIEIAKANNPSAEFMLLDCREIALLGKKFDALMCGFCLPYLSKIEVQNLLRDASEILTSGGILYISTIEDAHSNSGLKKSSQGDEIMMFFYETDFLVAALEKLGFEILHQSQAKYPAPNGTTTTDLMLVAKRK